MSKGFGGVPGNMQELIKEAQKMQERLQKAQEVIQLYEVDNQSGGGAVKVRMNGKYHLLSIDISRDAINPDDQEMLQELVMAAINGAVDMIQEYSRVELEKVTGGVSIPGLI